MVKPRKEYFKEPIIRVSATRIRYPATCPVCSSNATKTIRISAVPGRKQWNRPAWDHDWYDRGRSSNSLSQGQTFIVPVCEDHHYVEESESRYHQTCIIIDGIIISVLLIALMIMGSNFWLGRANPFWVYSVLTVFVVAMVLSYFAFRSNPFELAFRIVGFDAALQHIWLQLKNHEYRDAFLKRNPMSSELVSWIIRR